MPGTKLEFLQYEMFTGLQQLRPDATPLWGKMNAQQMVEHLAGFFDVSSGIIIYELITPEEQLPKYKAFLLSDKEFRENTKAPISVIGEEPLPVRFGSLQQALDELRSSVQNFINLLGADHSVKTVHPVFGPLNFEEWVLLHYKHVTHHLRQFGINF
jgi:oxepin-CoA hydrolase/3-oxo-5,6-dehydrosuberyl-CoA semialdehyde dehydrogenase